MLYQSKHAIAVLSTSRAADFMVRFQFPLHMSNVPRNAGCKGNHNGKDRKPNRESDGTKTTKYVFQWFRAEKAA